MKNLALILFVFPILFSCQKKESVLETEKTALNTVFNQVIDSVYMKSTENKTISDNVKKKILVINDSLVGKPGYVQFMSRFKTIKKLYFDTISEKIKQKIDLQLLEKKANFKYNYRSTLSKGRIPENFWNTDYALPGILMFSKICFDEERKFGAFNCTYTNGDIYNAKHFLIFIEKENEKWKLNEVILHRVIY